jgi:hypothetical protein
MDNGKAARPNLNDSDIDRLWQVFGHDDDLLAQRVAFFLLAESILLATAASLVNTVAGHQRSSAPVSVRDYIFWLAIFVILGGLGLTIVFWYVFRLNFDNVGADLDLLRESHSIYAMISDRQSVRRHSHKFFPALFRRRGINWVTVNCLALGFMLLWSITGIFAVLIFVSG